jgi:hypothetical protein
MMWVRRAGAEKQNAAARERDGVSRSESSVDQRWR